METPASTANRMDERPSATPCHVDCSVHISGGSGSMCAANIPTTADPRARSMPGMRPSASKRSQRERTHPDRAPAVPGGDGPDDRMVGLTAAWSRHRMRSLLFEQPRQQRLLRVPGDSCSSQMTLCGPWRMTAESTS